MLQYPECWIGELGFLPIQRFGVLNTGSYSGSASSAGIKVLNEIADLYDPAEIITKPVILPSETAVAGTSANGVFGDHSAVTPLGNDARMSANTPSAVVSLDTSRLISVAARLAELIPVEKEDAAVPGAEPGTLRVKPGTAGAAFTTLPPITVHCAVIVLALVTLL